jgi:hypothetical protein
MKLSSMYKCNIMLILLIFCLLYSKEFNDCDGINPDSIVKGIYVNPYQASKKDYLEEIFAKVDSGLINTIVIDFKSDYGFLTYASNLALAKEIDAIKKYFNISYLIKNAEEHNVKLIGRIVCFRDNYLSRHEDYGLVDLEGEIWEDKTGIAWTNPYKKEVTDYLIEITKEVVKLGIKSIAYDYIRFPTDRALEQIDLTGFEGPHIEPILRFLKRAQDEVDAEIGICVFGCTAWYRLINQGQDIKKMGKHVDVLYPMFYPSHFNPEFKGEVDEDERNYYIYFDSVKEAFKKVPSNVKVIPFVQGFDLRAKNFSADYVFKQILGAVKACSHGFMVWNARGDYSISWNALSWAHSLFQQQSFQTSPDIHRKGAGRRYQDIVPQ